MAKQNKDSGAIPMEVSTTKEQHLAIISGYGSEIVRSMIAVSDVYYKMCLYIRTHDVAEELVRDALEPLGFIKQRITEINRVSKASKELWSEFEARRLSFRRTLELTRGTVQLLMENQRPELAEQFPDAPDGETKEPSTPEERKEGDREALKASAFRMCKLAEKLGVRARTWQAENGWSVKVWKGAAPGRKHMKQDAVQGE